MSKAPSPGYSKAKPPRRDGEYEQPTHEIGGDILILGAGAGNTEIIAGDNIEVEDLSDTATDRFRISYVPYVGVSVDLSLVTKEVGVTKSSPILKGTVIDRLELTWTINKSIVSQTLANTGSLLIPVLLAATRLYTYIGVNVQSNMSLTLQANDGEGESGSIDSDVVSVSFGNNLILGIDVNRSGMTTSGIITALDTMTKLVKTSRSHTYFATGGSNQHHYVAYPKSYGLATFTKGIFSGGYIRLKNVSGTLATELGGGDTETDIILANSKGFSEAYYVYMSLYDNQNDPINAFVIS